MGDSFKMGQLVSRTVCGVVGALYPGYMSYKAIKNTDVREYKRWMEYWTVYSFFLVAELFLDVFVSWLPFYYEGKILFMVWLMMGGGARMVFRQFLKPTLALHEDKIDEQFEMMKKTATGKVVGMGKMAAKRVQKMSSEAFLSNGGMVDMLLKSGEAALTGDEQSESESESASSNSNRNSNSKTSPSSSSSSSSSSKPESFSTLGALVQGLTHPKLSKAVDKPGASGSPERPGAMDFFHGGITHATAEERLAKGGLSDGLFLVWTEGTKLGRYELSVVQKGTVEHLGIERGANSMFSVVSSSSGGDVSAPPPYSADSKRD